jgi:DNA-binding transcriptional MerR regulator
MKAGARLPRVFQGEANSKMSSAASVAVSEEQDERYYRIGEVSRITGVRPFVLRYWEEEFPMLEPVKGRQGYRLYRQQDVDLVLKIKRLLYDEGFTIAGARRHLRDLENGGGLEAAVEELTASTVTEGEAVKLNRKMLLDLRDSLRSFLTLLEGK